VPDTKTATYRDAALAMSEEELQDAVIQAAQLQGWVVVHHRPARTEKGWRTAVQGQKGFPDLVLARDGRVLFRELKTTKGKPTANQEIWLEALGDLGGIWRPADWLSGRIQHELRRTR
jgi:hypothetical protein